MTGLLLLIPFFLPKLHKLLLSCRFYSLPEAVAHKNPDFNNKRIIHTEQQVIGDCKGINVFCELDTNLLGEIMGRLCLTDQARFRAVCKKWLPVHPITNKKSLPWYLTFDRSLPVKSGRFEFRLYDPSYAPNLASLHNLSLTKFAIPSPPTYMKLAVTLKKNWLFISISKPRYIFWTRKYFLFYSLFTKEVIVLPRLDYPRRFKFKRMFSTDPDSPNRVFFLSSTLNADKIVIVTYRTGDTQWNPREFDRADEFVPCCNLVYLGGVLYIVSPLGQIASYNIVDGVLKFENLFIDELFAVNYNSSWLYEVFELNGELMLIYFGSPKTDNDAFPGKQCVRKYDWSNKVWISVSTLGDKTLFVGDNFDSVATVNKEETRNSGVLTNKIYRFFEFGCVIYSLEDGDLVEFKSIDSNLLDYGGSDLPKCKYNCGVTYSDPTQARYWLEPPDVLY